MSTATTSGADAIARRRAELRRLQERQRGPTSSSASRARPRVTSPTELLSKSDASAAPPVRSSNGAKVASAPSSAPLDASRGPPTMMAPHIASASKVPVSTRSLPAKKPSIAPSSGNSTASGGKPPPPPPVARKLEFAKQRSKSAPPARPPPPPPRRPAPGVSGTSKEAPSRVQSPAKRSTAPPARRRPEVLSATSLVQSKANGQAPPLATTAPGPTTPPTMMAEKPPTTTPPLAADKSETAADHVPEIPPTVPSDTKKEDSSPSIATNKPSVGTAPPVNMVPNMVNGPPKVETVQSMPVTSPPTATPSTSKPEEQTTPQSTVPNFQSEAAKRLEGAVKQAEQEKVDALKRVQELEDMLAKAKQEQIDANKEKEKQALATPQQRQQQQQQFDHHALQEMLQRTDQQGVDAAVQWARDQLAGVPPTVIAGAKSPLGARQSSRSTISSRTVTPHPKFEDKAQQDMVQVERNLIQHFREAVDCTPHEYSTALATFTVRRPYGMEAEHHELFDIVSITPHAMYSRKAHVSAAASLEVAVSISADENRLLLFSTAGVRYSLMHVDGGSEWKVVDHVDELDRPLGHVTYIDAEANERDYSLDKIVEEALLVREDYCRTLTSTALAFEQRPAPAPEVNAPPAAVSKPPMTDAAVDTADIPYPPDVIEVPNDQKADQGREAPPPPVDDPENGGGDVLMVFLGMIANSIIGTIYWIFIGFPLSVVRTSLVTVVVTALLALFYLYLLQDHNGHAMSHMSFGTSSPFHNGPGVL